MKVGVGARFAGVAVAIYPTRSVAALRVAGRLKASLCTFEQLVVRAGILQPWCGGIRQTEALGMLNFCERV